MVEWIVLGSSASAPQFLRAIRAQDASSPRTITTNVGLWLLWPDVPDVYFLTDHVACRQYRELAYEAQARGTRLVTMRRDRSALQKRGVERFDEFLEFDHGGSQTRLRRGSYGHVIFSGMYCLQYALHSGASRVYLVGMEGYPRQDSRHHHSKQHLGPLINSAAEEWPEVEFVFCGEPQFELRGMTIIKTPGELQCVCEC